MANERLRSKSELKKFVATNLKRKGLTDDMVSILIDVLWRDDFTMRNNGFYTPGATETTISFESATRTFSILPTDPLVPDFIPRYGFYSWNNKAVYHRRFETETIQIPNEEGLFAIYFDNDETTRAQVLNYVKDPTTLQLKNLYTNKVIVAFVYWDFDNQQTIHFGNDRHGSEWNPQMQWYIHKTLKARVNEGLTITNLLINRDGSLDNQAQFLVISGSMWHDDFLMDIPAAGGTETIKILYFSGIENKPRFISTPNFGCFKSTNRIAYNQNSSTIADVDSGKFCMYHIFAVNEHSDTTKKVITVMGNNQYDTLAQAHKAIKTELDTIYRNMPQQGTCYLGSPIFETNDSYENTVKARIVFFGGEKDSHQPVTIHQSAADFFKISEDQELNQKQTIFTQAEITTLLAAKAALSHSHDDLYFTEAEVTTLLEAKAALSHNHNEIYFTETEITTLLTGKADSVHTHDYAASSHDHNTLYFTEAEITTLLEAKAALSHSHNDLYFTEAEVATLLEAKAALSHTHDYAASSHDHNTLYFTEAEITSLLTGKSDTGHTHDSRYYTEAEITSFLAAKAASSHSHNDLYFTEAEVTTLLAAKAALSHTHDYAPSSHDHNTLYFTETEVTNLLTGKSDTGHTHDSRYYTETETNTLLAGKAASSHTHDDRYYTESEINTKLANISIDDLNDVSTDGWAEGKILKFDSYGELSPAMDEVVITTFSSVTSRAEHILVDYWDCKIYARVEVYIFTPYTHMYFATKAAYISVDYVDGVIILHDVDIISQSAEAGSPSITIEAVDGGTSVYFRVVFTGLNTSVTYKAEIFVAFLLKDTSNS